MGNILQTLQGALQPQVDPLAQYRPSLAGPGGVAGPVQGQTEGVMGFPSIPYGIDERGALSTGDPSIMQNGAGPPALATPEDNQATVSGWRPKKPTVLGTIADAFLMSRGMKPAYQLNRDQMNETNAIKGLTQNPMEAIRRVGMLKGHAKDAWDMYNQQFDNESARLSQERMNRSLDMRNEDYMYNYVANMMGTATEGTWGQMRSAAIKRAVARGMDPAVMDGLIPKEFDPTAIDFIRMGEVKVKDQIGIQQKNRGLDQKDRSLDQTDTKIGDQRDYRNTRIRQIDTAEEGRNDRHNTPQARAPAPAKNEVHYIKTKYGLGEVSPSGHTMRIKRGDKYIIYNNTGPNQWQLAGTQDVPVK